MRIIQKFSWSLDDITRDLINDKLQGFDTILVSPLQMIKQPTSLDNLIKYDWWLLYQPCNFKVGNVLGTSSDFEKLCNEAHKHGINVLVDVVCNHVAGSNDRNLEINSNVDETLKNDKYNIFKRRKFYDGCYHTFQRGWDGNGFIFENLSNWDNRNEVITGWFDCLPTLNTSDYKVQEIIYNYMNELISLGCDGFRIDSAKNIALPEEQCEFFNRLKTEVHNTKQGAKPYFFSEVLYDRDPFMVRKYENYTDVYTDNKEVSDNDDKAIGCFESHDQFLQPRNFNHNILYGNDYGHAYCNLVSRKRNTLLYVRPNDYLNIKEIFKLEDQLIKETDFNYRLVLQNKIDKLKNEISYYNEYIRNSNLYNDNLKKIELEFYKFTKSIDFLTLNNIYDKAEIIPIYLTNQCKYTKEINLEYNLINAYKLHNILTPHYMFEYCLKNNIDLIECFFNKEAIDYINKIVINNNNLSKEIKNNKLKVKK